MAVWVVADFWLNPSSGGNITVPAGSDLLVLGGGDIGAKDGTAGIGGQSMPREASASSTSGNSEICICALESPPTGSQVLNYSSVNDVIVAAIKFIDVLAPINYKATNSHNQNDGLGINVDTEDGDFVFFVMHTTANPSKWSLSGCTRFGEAGNMEAGYEEGVAPTASAGGSNPGSDSEWSAGAISFKAQVPDSNRIYIFQSSIAERLDDIFNWRPRPSGLWQPEPQILTPTQRQVQALAA